MQLLGIFIFAEAFLQRRLVLLQSLRLFCSPEFVASPHHGLVAHELAAHFSPHRAADILEVLLGCLCHLRHCPVGRGAC